ncbi:MAG: cobaltochelatase subunit CobN, partial [Schwartzia sp.]|nr:cobaltochelatase subunit CobN [Schwartzia sp. (in: firmicutes)]
METKIIYLTNDARRYAGMKNACLALQDEGKISDLCMAVMLEGSSEWNYVWERKLGGASLVVARFFRNISKSAFWEACRAFLAARNIPYLLDAVEGAADEKGEKSAGVEPPVAARLKGYTFYGGAENFKNFWLYASSLTDAAIPAPDEPKQRCWAGVYHPDLPDGCTTDLALYRAKYCKPDRPTLGLLFYRDEWIWDDLVYPAAFIAEAERQDCNAIAVFTNQLPDEALGMPSIRKVFEDFFTADGKTVIDTLVSTMKFSQVGNGTMTVEELEKFGVPILAAYTLLTTEKDWRANAEGLNAVETSIAAALPELDGAIHGVPIAGRNVLPDGAVEYVPMPERLSLMVEKAKKWARLRRLKNGDKKIALIFHNYPPKNYNIGSASGLDTMESA